jgi:hypothetical protein
MDDVNPRGQLDVRPCQETSGPSTHPALQVERGSYMLDSRTILVVV